jgi:acetyl-CoA carboxylase beta subunit
VLPGNGSGTAAGISDGGIFAHGLIDSIRARKDMKDRLAYYLEFLMTGKTQTAA